MEKTYRLRFTKLGPARFLSHIELSAALSRAIILSGISFVYSQGFHPHPKISFAGATAVGMESEGEFADIRIQDPGEKPGTLIARINAALPSGVAVTAMHELPPHAFSLAEMVTGFDYDLILPDDFDRGGVRPDRGCDPGLPGGGELRRNPRVKGETGHQGYPPLRRCPHPGPRLPPDIGFPPISARKEPSGPPSFSPALFGISPEALHRIRIVKTGARLADFAGEADREIFFPDSAINSIDRMYPFSL